MKTAPYRLQTEIEHLASSSQKEWFENYLKELLESDRPYYVKSDYIALSFMELENKIAYLNDEIKTLTELKKRLQQAKRFGLEIAAETLQAYGIEKLEGAAISSLTIAPPKTKRKERIHIKDPEKVMELGYVTFDVDVEAVKEAIQHANEYARLAPYIAVEVEEEHQPARLKINKRRSSHALKEAPELLDAA